MARCAVIGQLRCIDLARDGVREDTGKPTSYPCLRLHMRSQPNQSPVKGGGATGLSTCWSVELCSPMGGPPYITQTVPSRSEITTELVQNLTTSQRGCMHLQRVPPTTPAKNHHHHGSHHSARVKVALYFPREVRFIQSVTKAIATDKAKTKALKIVGRGERGACLIFL
ncbi:hypothetical protein RRG08_043937 [Elysia crispata]|uniref:Uncharacterized protein n=1 Tax=Elysia crispata TaxID=231223 RepID=A0AAE0Y077_9GAST|nr:hypothetical protein RRG08_043937 [Elysia crispata]